MEQSSPEGIFSHIALELKMIVKEKKIAEA
jgi:hypothetical protein